MDAKEHHFVARAGKGSNSPYCKTLAEAIDWAKSEMGRNSQVVSVPIYELHSVVEREAPPISVKEVAKPADAPKMNGHDAIGDKTVDSSVI